MLDLFNRPNLDETSSSVSAGKKLYLIPSTHGDSFDPDFAPNPSPLSELPNIERWTLMYIVSALEILAGRRSPQQVARSTHRFTYNTILQKVGILTELPKIKKIHRHQPNLSPPRSIRRRHSPPTSQSSSSTSSARRIAITSVPSCPSRQRLLLLLLLPFSNHYHAPESPP